MQEGCFLQTRLLKTLNVFGQLKGFDENLFQNMPPNLWNAQTSFRNTSASIWGFKRKLKAQLRVWKARPSVWNLSCVFVLQHHPCCPNQPRYTRHRTMTNTYIYSTLLCLLVGEIKLQILEKKPSSSFNYYKRTT